MANKPISKQKGFIGLIDLYAVIAAVIVFMAIGAGYLSDRQIEQDADRLKQHIEGLIKAINAYQSDMYTAGISFRTTDIFPNTLNDLMPNYLPSCTAQENRNRQCKLPTQTPWGQNIGYSTKLVAVPVNGGTVDVPGYELTIPVGLEPTAEYRHTYAAALMRLPFSKWDESTGLLTVSFGRLGTEVEHEALLRSDGTTPLTGDYWDTGGKSMITNVKGLFLRNLDSSQYSVASGLQRIFVVRSGTYVHAHSCPIGHRADIDVMIKSIEPLSNNNKFINLGSFTPYYKKEGNGWRVYAKYFVKSQNGNQQWIPLSDANLKVTQLCVQ